MTRFNLIVVKHLESIQYLKEHNFYTCGEYKDGFQVYTRDYFGTIYGDVIELHEVGAVPLRNLNEGHLAFLEYDDILRIDCR